MNLLSGANICIGFLLYFLNSLGPGAECFCWGLDFDVGFRSALLAAYVHQCFNSFFRPLYFLNRFGPVLKCSCWGLDLYLGFCFTRARTHGVDKCLVYLVFWILPIIFAWIPHYYVIILLWHYSRHYYITSSSHYYKILLLKYYTTMLLYYLDIVILYYYIAIFL